jgi:Ice-binding-like/Bacterial Ig-like domain
MHSHTLSFALLATFAIALGCGGDDDGTTEGPAGRGGVGGSGGAGNSTGGSGGSGGGGSGGSTVGAPTVLSSAPADGATNVATNGNATATFSEPMDCASLTAATFTVTSGATAVAGTVICSRSVAVFWPAARLPSNAAFTATITTGAKSLANMALAADHEWTFTTGDLLAPGLPVGLGAAGNFAILAKAAISSVPTSAITGDIGVSPSAASFITGFSLTADATNVSSTSPQVTGKVYAADFAAPTPSNLTTAVADMQLAFTDAAARAPDVTELGAGNIGGLTLAAGVYKWGTGVLIPTSLTLDGDGNDVWVFQIAQDLTVSSAAHITLAGGAQAKNVFWQVAGLVDIGTTAHFEGVVLAQTAITMQTGASIEGRLLAQTAVNLDSNAVVQPAP